jgi:NAD(P)-dependent dehydrogenase (short-subunit alcohol dehydrogenase family)
MTPLASLQAGYRAWVFGAHGGIGAACINALLADPRCAHVHAGARKLPLARDRVTPFRFDARDEDSIATACANAAQSGQPDLVLVTIGMLHAETIKPEKSWRALSAAALSESFAINAIAPSLIAKHCLAHLPRDRKSVFAALSARVGSITDNRLGGWHSYRASKAALNMLLRCCAIELAARNANAVCVALHPGTVDTAMSAPFQAGVAAEKLFTPARSAAALLAVIDQLTPADSGGFFAWDGAAIPF